MHDMMYLDVVVLIALLGGIAYFAFVGPPSAAERKSPEVPKYLKTIDVPEGAQSFMDELEAVMDEFFKKSERSYSSCSRDLFDGMKSDADVVEKKALEILYRMPNDAYAERDARVAIKNIQKIMDAHIEDMRKRCGFAVVKKIAYPIPAHNDGI